MFNKIDNWFNKKAGRDRFLKSSSGGSVVSVAAGTISLDVSLETVNFTAAGGNLYRFTTLADHITVILPDASSNENMEIGFKLQLDDLGGKTVILTRAGSDTIEGQTSYVLNVARTFLKLKSDGVSEWMIV